jgi:hypothetical protein
MTLNDVSRFNVGEEAVRTTDSVLREAGADGYERFVLWTGVRDGYAFNVRTTHVPAQTAFRTRDGVCVRVEGEALDRLNRWQYEHGESLGIQVHSHPKEAYHSITDDTYPIVTQLGGLSLVVPDFARGGLRGPGVAAYRLGPEGWEELEEAQSRSLVVLA